MHLARSKMQNALNGRISTPILLLRTSIKRHTPKLYNIMKRLLIIIIAASTSCGSRKGKIVEIEKAAKYRIDNASFMMKTLNRQYQTGSMRDDSFAPAFKQYYIDSVDSRKTYDSCEFELKKF